ncbi:hypothetical protein D0Y65_051026 [Glycine soja]|uniref:DNA helicase Pif1-like 2B domain-containing protein n=1 Tax=Glycine soja TaxID=3848 RepID=A0A445FEE5_GLYSO|nr:hypothetical protein D0Y65_051026 [Glycine soja]
MNMRLHSNLESVDQQETATFAKWILDIGDGIIGDENDGYATIQVPAHLLITQYDDSISGIVKSTFPDLDQHHNNPEFFKSKAILASTNETVGQMNHYLLSFIPGDHMEYLSSDSVDKSETSEDSYFQSITTEFLNSLNRSGLPTHSIKLKIGSPIMLLRNLDQNQGLCNGTRLVVTKMAKHMRYAIVRPPAIIQFRAALHNDQEISSHARKYLEECDNHLTIIRKNAPPLQWDVVTLDRGIKDKSISQP